MKRTAFAALAALLLAFAASVGLAVSDKPNVVCILADNTGWGDFSEYGGTVPTPRIDSIAVEGYMSSPVVNRIRFAK